MINVMTITVRVIKTTKILIKLLNIFKIKFIILILLLMNDLILNY